MAGEACNENSGSAELSPGEWVVDVSGYCLFVLVLGVLEGGEFGVEVEVVVQVDDVRVVVESSVSGNIEKVAG